MHGGFHSSASTAVRGPELFNLFDAFFLGEAGPELFNFFLGEAGPELFNVFAAFFLGDAGPELLALLTSERLWAPTARQWVADRVGFC